MTIRKALVAAVIAVALGVALVVLATARSQQVTPAATAEPTAALRTTTPLPTASPAPSTPSPAASICPEPPYLQGDDPIVPPRASGPYMTVALDAVRPGQSGHNRWFVRFFVRTGAPGNAEIPLRASVTGPTGGPLQIFGYEAGPPNAGTAKVTETIVLSPCQAPNTRSVVSLGVETSAVTSGTYTLTLAAMKRPEGTVVDERWTVTLSCTPDAGAPGATPTTLCR